MLQCTWVEWTDNPADLQLSCDSVLINILIYIYYGFNVQNHNVQLCMYMYIKSTAFVNYSLKSFWNIHVCKSNQAMLQALESPLSKPKFESGSLANFQ